MDYKGDKFDTKAAELIELFNCDWLGDHHAANAQDWIAAALKQAAHEARAEEREAIAKIVCPSCRDETPLKNSGTHLVTTQAGAVFEVACRAAAIRARKP